MFDHDNDLIQLVAGVYLMIRSHCTCLYIGIAVDLLYFFLRMTGVCRSRTTQQMAINKLSGCSHEALLPYFMMLLGTRVALSSGVL